VELGILSLSDLQTSLDTGQPVSAAQRIAETIDYAVLGDQLGLDLFALGEYHALDYAVSSPAVVLAAIAARTEQIRLTSAVTVLSTLDPVRVYQDFAQLGPPLRHRDRTGRAREHRRTVAADTTIRPYRHHEDPDIMNVTVFGATGAIGQLMVTQLLTAGHPVTAYVRDVGKIPASWPNDLRVVVGEITDAAAIDTAVTGADAVISALGPSMDRKATGLPLVEGTRLIIDAMRRHGVPRFIGNGTPSIRDKRDQPTSQQRLIGFLGRTMLPRAYRELIGMSDIIMTSGLDWTIVRFTAPKDGPAQSVKRYGFYGTDKIGFNVTRADIAAFTAAQLTDDRYHNAAPAISN